MNFFVTRINDRGQFDMFQKSINIFDESLYNQII
jgi:hypothetical protein